MPNFSDISGIDLLGAGGSSYNNSSFLVRGPPQEHRVVGGVEIPILNLDPILEAQKKKPRFKGNLPNTTYTSSGEFSSLHSKKNPFESSEKLLRSTN